MGINDTKKQHYVPQFLLRNFPTEGKEQLWVYDKANDNVFPSNIKDIASENKFYDFKVDGEGHSLEEFMGKIEASAAPIIRRIVGSCSITSMSEDEKKTLSVFFAIQFLRTKHQRDNRADFSKQFREALLSKGIPEKMLAEAGVVEATREDIIRESSLSILEYEKYAGHFFSKDWVLHKSDSSIPLYTSDNPICLFHRQPTDGFWSNRGLAVPGIEIYLPLSNNLLLGMLCPTIKIKFEITLKAFDSLPNIPQHILAKETAPLRTLLQKVGTGIAVPLSLEQIAHYNSLQVTDSERFIYCSTNEFDHVQNMLQENPEYRHGRRGTVT
jgi:hypothetical protein